MSGANTTERRARSAQPLRKREGHLRDVGLIDQFTGDAARQAIGIDRHGALRQQAQAFGKAAALSAQRGDRQRFGARVVQQEAPKVDRQVFLQASQHDLKDAGQVLPLACCASDVLQETQAA